jgi:hypothetical protein
MQAPCCQGETLMLGYGTEVSEVTQFHIKRLSVFPIDGSRTNVEAYRFAGNPISVF